MLPLMCQTCRKLMGDKQLRYEGELEKICRDYEMKKYSSAKEMEDDKIKLINKMGLKRYCCRTLIMTYVKLINIIK